MKLNKIFLFPLIVTLSVVFSVEVKIGNLYLEMMETTATYADQVELAQLSANKTEDCTKELEACHAARISLAKADMRGFPAIYGGFRIVAYALCVALFIAAFLAFKEGKRQNQQS